MTAPEPLSEGGPTPYQAAPVAADEDPEEKGTDQ